MERVGRDRTIGAYHLDLMPMVGLTDDGMPVMMPCDVVPDDLLGFNYATGCKDPDVRRSNGVHFFLDDYQFERIWRFPLDYGDRLADFQCVLTPDFSLYRDMPLPMQRWNCYRSRFVGAVGGAGRTPIPEAASGIAYENTRLLPGRAPDVACASHGRPYSFTPDARHLYFVVDQQIQRVGTCTLSGPHRRFVSVRRSWSPGFT